MLCSDDSVNANVNAGTNAGDIANVNVFYYLFLAMNGVIHVIFYIQCLFLFPFKLGSDSILILICLSLMWLYNRQLLTINYYHLYSVLIYDYSYCGDYYIYYINHVFIYDLFPCVGNEFLGVYLVYGSLRIHLDISSLLYVCDIILSWRLDRSRAPWCFTMMLSDCCFSFILIIEFDFWYYR